MNIEVVTCINQKGYNLFARDNFKSFNENWPKNITLTVYSEDDIDYPHIDLYNEIPLCFNYIQRNKNKRWKPPYSQKQYKQDHLKFCYKVYTVCHRAFKSDADYLIWLDSDITTIRPITINLLQKYCNDYFCSYLNRESWEGNNNLSKMISTETGFIIFNLKHRIKNEFFKRYQEIYDTDEIFKFNEIHDGYIFDQVVNEFNPLYFKRLTNGTFREPLSHIELGKYLSHTMGRKKWGFRKNRST